MKTKYTLFRRWQMFYMQDSATGKQTSLRTKDETEAKSLLEARNAAQRQPVLNLHLARAYLTASDPAFVERTCRPSWSSCNRVARTAAASVTRPCSNHPALTPCVTRNFWKRPPTISLPCSKT